MNKNTYKFSSIGKPGGGGGVDGGGGSVAPKTRPLGSAKAKISVISLFGTILIGRKNIKKNQWSK